MITLLFIIIFTIIIWYPASHLFASLLYYDFPPVRSCNSLSVFTLWPVLNWPCSCCLDTEIITELNWIELNYYFPLVFVIAEFLMLLLLSLLLLLLLSLLLLKNTIFLNVMPCGSCRSRCFERTYRLHHQGKNGQARNNVSSNYEPKHTDDGGDTFLWSVGLAIIVVTAAIITKQTNSVGFSPQANYTDWATAICRRNLVPTFPNTRVSRGQCSGSPTVVNLSFLDRCCYFFFK
jgi:hypothetical protein